MKSKAAYHWPWIWCAWALLVMPCIALAFPGAASGLAIFSGIWLIVLVALLGTDTALDSGFGFFLGMAIILFGLFAGLGGEASVASAPASVLPDGAVQSIEEGNVLLAALLSLLVAVAVCAVLGFSVIFGMALHRSRKDWRGDAAKDDRSPECP